MNKKIIGIIAGVLAIVIVIAIVLLVGIKKLEKVTIPLQIDVLERTVSVTLGYPKNSGIVLEDTDWENSKIFKNEEKNYTVDVMLLEDSTYADNKDYDKEEEGYEEVKFGDFTGYIVKGEYDVEGKILLEDLSDQNIYVYLTFEVSAIESYIDDDWVDVKPLYELKEVQTILKSIKYDKGEDTVESTKQSIADEEEKEATTNYGEFASRSRTEGTSDKDGLIFIPRFENPDETIYKVEQRNDNVGIDNDIYYIAEDARYDSSGISVRIFPKDEEFESFEAYKEDKGDMYTWSKAKIGDKEYDVFVFGNSEKADKYSEYYSGAFMVGNKVVEFSYSMYEDVPDQTLGPKFFKQIIDSIEYSSEFNN